jgi:hypothetical protein
LFTETWATSLTAGAITQHFTTGYLLEKNRNPGRRQPWPLPPPIGPPRPFRSRARVDRAMGDAPYRRCHEIERGVVYDPTIHHLLRVRKKSSSWAPPAPAMASTAAYRPSAAVPLEGVR